VRWWRLEGDPRFQRSQWSGYISDEANKPMMQGAALVMLVMNALVVMLIRFPLCMGYRKVARNDEYFAVLVFVQGIYRD